MAEALKSIPESSHPNLLVGYNKADDAGVYKISDNLAVVQTLDFFPPIVDDPFDFGRIAAANALSDVYAMGGKPITAMNIVGFPASLPPYILTEILKGGLDKVTEAGAVVVGGHSVNDKELKFGVSVTGLIDPNKILTNSGAKIGDKIYLTKKLGTGIISTGVKREIVEPELEKLVTDQMAELNKNAAETMLSHSPNAATDITGFGLAGHAIEMADGSNVSIRINSNNLPILPQALELTAQNVIPGGLNTNRMFFDEKCKFSSSVDQNLQQLIFDPQTSGGLLIAIPNNNSTLFEQESADNKVNAVCIGEVVERGDFALLID